MSFYLVLLGFISIGIALRFFYEWKRKEDFEDNLAESLAGIFAIAILSFIIELGVYYPFIGCSLLVVCQGGS